MIHARRRRAAIWLLACFTAVLVVGCGATSPRVGVPEKLASNATIAGMGTIRIWGDQAGGALKHFIMTEARARASRAANRSDEVHLLAISGGADDGAFGAGLLVGWTASRNRPRFDLVTGISAGALIAPFAFLGPEYDETLAEVFKLYGGEDFYRTNVLSGLLGGTALADSAPLAAIITKYVNQRVIGRIAEERGKGRLLVVGTTNLDAQRPVYWDIGRIAQSREPEAAGLIHDILLASASIPGIFPPVRIRVVADGKSYEEMHVDGGPTREVFFAPGDFSFREFDRLSGRSPRRSLWIIRNSKLEPEYSLVQASTLAISQRSIETLTKYQSIGDLTRMYDKARDEGIDFNLISIPSGFSAPREQPFDRKYMQALFETGREIGRHGARWAKALPGQKADAR